MSPQSISIWNTFPPFPLSLNRLVLIFYYNFVCISCVSLIH
jgi:hypothetical protein